MVIGVLPGVNYGKIVGRVNTRGSIGDIDVSPDGQIIYVTHPLTNEVSVYQIEYSGDPNADASVNVSVNLELINVIEVVDFKGKTTTMKITTTIMLKNMTRKMNTMNMVRMKTMTNTVKMKTMTSMVKMKNIVTMARMSMGRRS